jgi:RNA-binding protein 39
VEMKDALDSDRSNDTHRSNRRRSRSPRRRGHDDRRGGDYWRRGGRSRSRSRSPDRYYRPGGRGGRRDGDRDGFRDRDRNGHNRGGRAPRRGSQDEGSSPRARRKTPEPQPTEDERDKRTVFVQQLAARLETRHLFEFFSKVGKVKDAQIVKDRVSQRSKGYVLSHSLRKRLTLSLLISFQRWLR